MLRIGLTGGIGSGKSTVAEVFEMCGAPVYYADIEAKRIMNTDSAVKAAIFDIFGEQAFIHGELNRPYIASVVFTDSKSLKLLNAIVHPATIKHSEQWFQSQDTPYAIKEAALIFESDSHLHLDYIIGVSAPEELRVRRVMARDKTSREDVMLRLNKQMNEEDKLKLCDFVITNDEHQMVLPQVLTLHEHLVKLSGEKIQDKYPRAGKDHKEY